MSGNLNYLIAAYSAIWLVLGAYIFILIARNRRLHKRLEDLEQRLADLEGNASSNPS